MLRDRHARNVSGHRHRAGPSRVRRWFAGGVVTATLAAASGCGGDDGLSAADLAERRERQAVAAAAEAGLADDVQAVLGTAARAPAAAFAATYRAGADRIVVHQRPPRRRVDVIVGGAARESVVSDGEGEVRCERPAGQDWSCSAAPRSEADGAGAGGFGAFSPELVARTVEALEDAAGSFELDVVERRIAGVDAACLRSRPVDDPGAPPAWLCVAPDGVPLLVDRGDGTPELRAVAYRRGATADDVARPDR